MAASELDVDINKTIAAAINTKIEAAVMQALSGDEVFGQYIAAALTQPADIGNGYNSKRTTFLNKVVMEAMQAAVKQAVANFMAEEIAVIEAEVRKAFKSRAADIAKAFVDQLTDRTIKTTYGIEVGLRFPSS